MAFFGNGRRHSLPPTVLALVLRSLLSGSCTHHEISRNFSAQVVDTEAPYWDSVFGWQRAQGLIRAFRTSLPQCSSEIASLATSSSTPVTTAAPAFHLPPEGPFQSPHPRLHPERRHSPHRHRRTQRDGPAAAARCRLAPIPMRFVKYTVGGHDYGPATILLDRKAYSRQALADLLQCAVGRGKALPVRQEMAALGALSRQCEYCVLRALWACLTLITIIQPLGQPLRGREWLRLQQTAALSTTLDSVLGSLDCCRQRGRPNLSFPRVTCRPDRSRSSKKK